MNVVRRKRATIVERSLPNTKLPKNPGELFFGSHFAGDLAEEMQGAADIEAEQVAGNAAVEAGADFTEGDGDHHEGMMVAGIGDDGSFADTLSFQHTVHQGAFQLINAVRSFCRDKNQVLVGESCMQGRIPAARSIVHEFDLCIPEFRQAVSYSGALVSAFQVSHAGDRNSP